MAALPRVERIVVTAQEDIQRLSDVAKARQIYDDIGKLWDAIEESTADRFMVPRAFLIEVMELAEVELERALSAEAERVKRKLKKDLSA